MIRIKDTPQLGGVWLMGPREDLEELYFSLFELMERIDITTKGAPGDLPETALNTRIVALCSTIRHVEPPEDTRRRQPDALSAKIVAFPGNFAAGEPDEAMDEDVEEGSTAPANDQDQSADEDDVPALHTSRPILWPEIIFDTLALNHYLGYQYNHRFSRKLKGIEWSPAYATVRRFQVGVVHALCAHLSPTLATRVRNAYTDPLCVYRNYCTQYIDKLNADHLNKNRDQRLRFLAQLPTLMAGKQKEYGEIEAMIRTEALRLDCRPWDLQMDFDEPGAIVW
jgi:hypothetical protein